MGFSSSKTILALAVFAPMVVAKRRLLAATQSIFDENDSVSQLPSHSYTGNKNCEDLGWDYGWKIDGEDADFTANTKAIRFDALEETGSPGCVTATDKAFILDGEDPDGNQFKIANIFSDDKDCAIKMKGGNGGTLYDWAAGSQATRRFGVGNGKAISHIEFCFFCDKPAPTPINPASTPSAPAPTQAVPRSPGGGTVGARHFKTWGGDMFDFQGGCDLVLVKSASFANGLGLEIHIRTKISTRWSFIESAAIRIGEDTFEVKGANYWINGKLGAVAETGELESTIGGYHMRTNKIKDGASKFLFTDLFFGVGISFDTYNDFVRVNIKSDRKDDFEGALGLMGSYPTGAKVARDGFTTMDDTTAFGEEWQVRMDEAKLFHSVESVVQHPESCQRPPTFQRRGRRLSESRRVLLDLSDAKLACARVGIEDRDACIFDVLANNDKGMAGSY